MCAALAPAALGTLLVCTGCRGGGNGPTPSCTKWQPTTSGPGDTAAYAPFATGNRWVLGRSASGAAPWTQWVVEEVTGTRTVLGRSAFVLAESDLDTQVPLGEASWSLDDHGLIDPGNHDPSDRITPQIVPDYMVRFPLVQGDQFTSVDCSGSTTGRTWTATGRMSGWTSEWSWR